MITVMFALDYIILRWVFVYSWHGFHKSTIVHHELEKVAIFSSLYYACWSYHKVSRLMLIIIINFVNSYVGSVCCYNTHTQYSAHKACGQSIQDL